MTTNHMLTIRTTAALSRLAALQRRADKAASPARSVIQPALKELNDALEELQVANDQLQTQVDELAKVQLETRRAERRFADLLEWLPCPCIWTSPSGEIAEANPAAAALLNVSVQHLVGRPLVLFMTDRTKFTAAAALLAANVDSVVETIGVRPRERRARQVRVIGYKRNGQDRLCWFLVEQIEAAGNGTADSQPL